LGASERAFAMGEYQLSADDNTVTYSSGKSASISATSCETDGRRILSDFQKQIRDNDRTGRLIACELEVATYYPSVLNTEYHAGIFTLDDSGKRSRVAICYNNGVGYLALEPAGSMTRHDLIVFMMEHCTAG
jgi:hypothetical protein